MKKNRIALLPLFFFTPLLMANSPAPQPTDVEYKDISVDYVLLSESEGIYRYETKITNTGSMYVSSYHTHAFRIGSSYLYINKVEGKLFDSEMIKPGQTRTYIIETDRSIPDGVEWVTEVYDILDENITFTNNSIEKLNELRYQLKSDIQGKGDYYYAAIIEATYNGQEYAFEVDIDRKDVSFFTSEELDLAKLNINKITAYRSSYATYKSNYGNFIKGILIGVGIITLVSLGIISLIVIAIVVIITLIDKIRKKNKTVSK